MARYGPKPIDPSVRFWKKVDVTSDAECWLWKGYVGKYGYAVFNTGPGKYMHVHRFSYQDKVGPIPDGLELDHLCRVRHCVNPKHLEPVTRSENIKRALPDGGAVARYQREKTHCPRGHEYNEENTRIYHYKGRTARHCRACRRLRGNS